MGDAVTVADASSATSIDCDLWGFKPRLRDLGAHLSSSWHDWLRLDEQLTPSLGARIEVPESQYFVAGTALTGSDGIDDAVRRLRDHLDRTRTSSAIFNSGAASSASGITNGAFAADVARAANEWTVERWLQADGRLLGSIVVSAREPDRAAVEIRRAGADPRMAQVLLAYPPFLLGHRALAPIYEAAVELELPVNLQAGGDFSGGNGGVARGGLPSGSRLESLVAWEYGAQPHLVNLLVNGVFDRYPTLRVVFSGFGIGWVPSLLWRLDAEYTERRIELPNGLGELPSKTVAEHVRFTVSIDSLPAQPQKLVALLDSIDADQLLLLGTGPRRDAGLQGGALLARVPERWRRAIAATNAQRVYARLA
jgi:predicted TIM-barrel fold metal-dependent hydrolase